jgi:type IV pilus assembly protein PilO
LNFLRRVEALNLLVVQSDLNLSLPKEAGPTGKPINLNTPVVMKLALGLYSRTTEADGAPAEAAPTPPAQPN